MPIVFRQEGCLLKYSENGEAGSWLLAADLSQCQPPEIPANDPARICNGSVQLAEWLMLFLEHNIEQVGSSTDITQAIIGGVLEFFDDIPIPLLPAFIETLRGLIGLGLGSLTSPIYRQNVQRALYCRIRVAGKFDKSVFDDWIDPRSLPSDVPSYHLSQLAKAIPFEELLRRYQIYSLDPSSACELFEDCDPPCKLSAPQTGAYADEFSATESLTIPDQWKLASNPNIHPPGSSAYYFALFELPYGSSRCRIEINANDVHTFQLQPSPDGQILLYTTADYSTVEIYTNILDLNGKCFNSFAINGQGPLDVDIHLSECVPEPKPCPLYIINLADIRQLLTTDVDGNINLNSYGSLAPVPDTNGFRRYYLENTDSCCSLQRLPLNESGDLGITPTKLRIYACGDGETYSEYTYPADAQAFSDFFGGVTCFNSFALAPSYVMKVRMTACAAEDCNEENCQTYDFNWHDGTTTSTTGWTLADTSWLRQSDITNDALAVPTFNLQNSRIESPGYLHDHTPVGGKFSFTLASGCVLKQVIAEAGSDTTGDRGIRVRALTASGSVALINEAVSTSGYSTHTWTGEIADATAIEVCVYAAELSYLGRIQIITGCP